MKLNVKSVLALIICFALCFSLVNPVYAANESNTLGITFNAVFDTPTIETSETEQQVVMRLKASAPVSVDGIGFTVTKPNGWTIVSITGGDKLGDYDKSATSVDSGKALWSSMDKFNMENVDNVTELAVITFKIPAGAKGTYEAGVSGLRLTKDYTMDEWEISASATATITVEEPSAPPAEEAPYEIFYTLDSTTDVIGEEGTVGSDSFVEYGKDETVTATLYIKNNGTEAVSLQAYDIYLTYGSKLTPGEDFTLPDGQTYRTTVNPTADGLHIQAIGSNTNNEGVADINIPLPAANGEDNAVELGKITFTFNSDAEYDEELRITLTDNSAAKAEGSTNIGIANYIADGKTTGNKAAYYPAVSGDVQGAEINTTYTVSFNENGGTWNDGAAPTQNKLHNIDLTLNPAKTPSRVGYTFQGWSTVSGDNNAANMVTTYSDNATMTFYAVWSQNTFKVEWYGTDGTVIETDNNVAYGTQAEFNGTQPSKTVEGYTVTFLGWNTDSNATEALTTLTITGATKFYPIFQETINQYTVTFNTDGGVLDEGDSGSVTVDYNTNITLPNVTKTGHTFNGWYDGVTKVGDSGASYAVKKNVTLKAGWSAEKYNVTLNTNGGTITSGNVTEYTYGQSVTLPKADDMFRDGYTFAGWYDNENLEGEPVVSITGTDTGNKQYYAKWTANEFTVSVSFDEKEGHVTAVNKKPDGGASANVGDTIVVSVTPNPGYEISEVKWSSANNEEQIKIENGKGEFTMPAANVTVTAAFTKVALGVVTADIQHGSVTIKNEKNETIEQAKIDDKINLAVEPNTGYQINEVYYTYAGADGAEVKEIIHAAQDGSYSFTMPGYEVEVSATFEAIQYSIIYMDGVNQVTGLTPDKYTVEDENVTLPTPSKDGYKFLGWYEDSNFSGTAVTTITTSDAVNKTYYANYEVIEYTITYKDGENPITGLNPEKYTVTDANITLPAPSKDGYEFQGWYENSDLSGTAVTTITTSDAVNKTYYASYKTIEYTITFVVPNGTAIAAQTYTIESEYTLPIATNNNSLYAFKNWLASNAEGNWTNTEYNKDTPVNGMYGNVTLTAQWTEVLTYEIQEYKYAGSNQVMLLIATDSNTNAYTFDGQNMFFYEDDAYKVNGKNVFVTLISRDAVETVDGIKRLTTSGMANLVSGNAPAAKIGTSGDINGDNVTNIADANIVYQMIVNGGGYYGDLDIEYRLRADMVRATTNAVHRGSIEDVNAIVTIINGVNN